MKQMKTVFRFEFLNCLRTKAYRILTALVVIAILIGMSYPRIAGIFREDRTDARQEPVTELTREAVVVACAPDTISAGEMARDLAAQLPMYLWSAVESDEAALTEAVRAGEYAAGLWMADALTYRHIVLNTSMHDAGGSMIDEAVTAAYRIRTMIAAGMPSEESAVLAMARAQGETVALGRDGLASYIHTYALVMLLYMAVALYGQFVATSVAAEKSNRAMELLITNAKPTRLMFGKVLGAGSAGLAQIGLFVAAAFAGYRANHEAWLGNTLIQAVFAMSASVLAYALLFFVLGFFLYASLYAALGSLVSRSEEVSAAIMPVTLLFIVSFVIVMMSASTGSVDSALLYAASFIPLTSPMAMFVRITMGAPAGWEIVLSVGILAASAIAVAMIAAGIYRVGVLLYGKPPRIKELYHILRAARNR